jgi:hypothetical protein
MHRGSGARVRSEGQISPMARTKTNRDSTERRSRHRFCIGQEISYTCLSGTRTRGVGKVLDISSRGVRFTTEGALNPGTRVEVSIDWPARLNDTCLLKLIVRGSVLRSEASVAVIRIQYHEFRTRALQALPVSTGQLSYPRDSDRALPGQPARAVLKAVEFEH